MNAKELLSFDALFERAKNDHARWRGMIVQVDGALVGDGDDIKYQSFSTPLPVRITDLPLDRDDCVEHDGDGGLIDLNYNATLEGTHPEIAAGEHISCVDGPTYYRDGRIEWGSFGPAA